jgi:hypothetical protein
MDEFIIWLESLTMEQWFIYTGLIYLVAVSVATIITVWILNRREAQR